MLKTKEWSDKELIEATNQFIENGKNQNKIFWGEEGHECGICGMNPTVLEKAIQAYISEATNKVKADIIAELEKKAYGDEYDYTMVVELAEAIAIVKEETK